MTEPIQGRKSDHIRIALEEDVEVQPNSAFGRARLIYQAIPEIHRDDIDPSIEFLGRKLAFPLLIGSMTGGTKDAAIINQRLARAAQRCGIGMGLGSQRIMLEQPTTSATFQVRDVAPDILLVANLGAVQLNYGVGAESIQQLIRSVDADALVFHLNAAQEAAQPEGDTRFGDLIPVLRRTIEELELPCGLKEVGCGFSIDAARKLATLPLGFVESAGQGGTSWTRIEHMRSASEKPTAAMEQLEEWGIPSITSLLSCLRYGGQIPVVASGGLRTGVEAAHAVAMGAQATAMALPLLRAAAESEDAVYDALMAFRSSFVTAMFLTGSTNIQALQKAQLSIAPDCFPEVFEGRASPEQLWTLATPTLEDEPNQ
ncbi:MAG: type 2 isopentenyl-diphosphate Delta-isomerase [Myxococcales bacterium]|nr:type 2 isopentenyl-diphosphate Delta-isomerase [Myxococcales bacterium]|tara:strand:+ start:438 stop:1553 length:1116 start_codon:yes stop_codon:yes gene_type:complete